MPRLARPWRTRWPSVAANVSAAMRVSRVAWSRVLRFGFELGIGANDGMNYNSCNIVHTIQHVKSAGRSKLPDRSRTVRPTEFQRTELQHAFVPRHGVLRSWHDERMEPRWPPQCQ